MVQPTSVAPPIGVLVSLEWGNVGYSRSQEPYTEPYTRVPTMIGDIEILDLMLGDHADQPSVYQPGRYWMGYASRAARAIRSEGLVDFRSSNPIGRGFADTVTLDPFWDSRGR